MSPHPVLVTVGTRPEIIKMAPIIHALKSATIPFVFLHCGQHYDYNMSQQFIKELDLPTPNFSYEIYETQPALQTASITTAAAKNVQPLPPISYFDFLVLMKHSQLIITDSGGIQEEATAPPIRKQVLVMRLSTERPEAVEAGFAKVVGIESENILQSLEETLNNRKQLPTTSPYGDGKAAEKIVNIIEIHRESLSERF